MADAKAPKPVTEVIATLADIFRHKSQTEIVEVLECAHAHFEVTDYDNWNGGTYSWALRLEVPVAIFAALEPRLDAVEKEIGGKLNYLDRLYRNDNFGEVTISPITPGVVALGQRMAPSELEVKRLWKKDRFRLFLSHLSDDKGAVSKLKDELDLRGVIAFVAHEDIEPSREWCDEIELGLRSMHALAALITPGFHASKWTDQEIGWALGRGIPVLAMRLGCDPYGFIGKYQGLSGTLAQPAVLATTIVKTLLANQPTRWEMRRSIMTAFENSSSIKMSVALRELLVTLTDFTDEEKSIIWKACVENEYVSGAWSVPRPLYNLIGEPPALKETQISEDVPF